MEATTVSVLTIVCISVTLLICLVLVIGLPIWARRKFGGSFSFVPFIAGAFAFAMAELVIRMPLLYYILPQFDWYKALLHAAWPANIAYILLFSISAALVQEPARFIAFSVMKQRREFTDGLSFGIGHAGIDVLLMVGVTSFFNLLMAIMINSTSTIPPESIKVFLDVPALYFLLDGVEKIFIMAMQIALSLFMLKSFAAHKKVLYLVAAIVLHGTAVLAVSIAQAMAGRLASAGVLMVVAVLSVLYIIRQARQWQRSFEQ